MKLTIIGVLISCLFSFSLFAQNSYSIKGSVADSAAKVKLGGTTIAVLNAKDSIMRAFTWAAGDGSFAIDNLPKGKFILLVTYPGYADYVDDFTLDSTKSSHDFGAIDMILKSRLLQDVIIKGEVTAIKIKGDTTEYNARAYKIEPNAKVEDLLKQLPGIEVDKDGKITAQGQVVKNVLVDGEEFFGDDPTLVTKNIRADMVDKVQVYDKKSDQATFTGIDDGVKDKTINIKLQEGKKNGYFGKAEAGVGTDDYYEGQLLFNKFKAKEKFSVYGITSNNGKIGLGWEDANKYGTSNNDVQFGDGGSIMIFSSGSGDDLDSFNGQYNNQGLPIARTGGFHYDGKWNSDKESINTNYKIGSLQVDGKDSTLNQNNLPGDIINTSSAENFHKYIFRQKLDLTYQIKLDTTSNLKISIDGTEKHSNITEDYMTRSYRNIDTLLNTNNRQITNNVDQQIFDASAFYTKKFKKKGRTLSFNVSESVNQSNSKGYLKSLTNFYGSKAELDSSQRINQYKTLVSNSAVFNTNLTYTEPLTKRLSLILNYAVGIDNGRSDRESHDSTAAGRYDLLDTALSNNYKLNQFSNQVGAIFNYKKDKNVFNFGSRVSDVSFQQVDAFTGDVSKRHFLNWAPQASYQHNFSQQQSVYLSYQGNTTQPTLSQIQPVKVNTDPLNITIGNPDLKPSFNNNFNFYYNSYKVITGQSIWLNGSYSFTTNPIVSNTVTDTTGKTTYQSVNLGSKRPSNYYFGAYLGQKVKPIDIEVGADLNTNGSTTYNYSNNALNTTDSHFYSASLRVSKYKEKAYEMQVSFGPTYTINQSSLQQQINNNGRGYNGSSYFAIYLPAKFMITSDANYQFTEKTQSFNSNFSRLLVNASLAKTFLKDDNLKISVSGNDLLNQNVGFSRSANGNMITQDSYTTIKRYFMLSISWDFSKVGGAVLTKN